MTHEIVFKYFRSFTAPVAKITADLQSYMGNGKHHCIKETSCPIRHVIYVGAVVMLLQNFIVEYKLTNGSVKIVRHIIYKESLGSKDPINPINPQPAYVIVEFTKSIIPKNDKLIPDMPSTYTHIPMTTTRCDKNDVQLTSYI